MIRNKVKPEKKHYARKMRNNPTFSENTLWQQLRKEKLGVKFRRQSIIRGYIADFYCPELHIVIEVDGNSHNDKTAYDSKRDAAFSCIGIKTLRFTNLEVNNSIDYVLGVICKTIIERTNEHIIPFRGVKP